MATRGEILAAILETRGIEAAFRIPGTYHVELYRGLPATGIRHATPRHATPRTGCGFHGGWLRSCDEDDSLLWHFALTPQLLSVPRHARPVGVSQIRHPAKSQIHVRRTHPDE